MIFIFMGRKLKYQNSYLLHCWWITLGLIWGWISAPPHLKNEQKLPKMVVNISNFLVLHSHEKIIESDQK